MEVEIYWNTQLEPVKETIKNVVKVIEAQYSGTYIRLIVKENNERKEIVISAFSFRKLVYKWDN